MRMRLASGYRYQGSRTSRRIVKDRFAAGSDPQVNSPKKLKYIAYYYAKNLKKWGATNIHIKYRGKRDLAYLVKDNNVANYIEISFDIYPYNLTSYNRILKLDEKIIRSFLIKK